MICGSDGDRDGFCTWKSSGLAWGLKTIVFKGIWTQFLRFLTSFLITFTSCAHEKSRFLKLPDTYKLHLASNLSKIEKPHPRTPNFFNRNGLSDNLILYKERRFVSFIPNESNLSSETSLCFQCDWEVKRIISKVKRNNPFVPSNKKTWIIQISQSLFSIFSIDFLWFFSTDFLTKTRHSPGPD